MSLYKLSQIQAAKKLVRLHGFQQAVTDEQAIQILNFHFIRKRSHHSELEAITYVLMFGANDFAAEKEFICQLLNQAGDPPLGAALRYRPIQTPPKS